MAEKSKIAIELELLNGEYLAKIKKSSAETKKFAKSTESSISGATKAWQKLAGVAGAAYLTKQFLEFAGAVDSVTRAFNKMTRSYDTDGKKLVKSVQNASKGTISQLDIMKSSTLAMQLMGKDVIEFLPEMSEVALAAARASGEDASKMLNDIVVASGRRSIMILDNLGISSAVAAKHQAAYAASLGKTRAQLNEAEKSQAFFYAVMKAGGEMTKRLSGETLSFGEKLQVMEAAAKDAATEFTKTLLPTLDEVSSGFDVSGESMKEFAIGLGVIASAAVRAAGMIAKVVKVLSPLTKLIQYNVWAIKQIGKLAPEEIDKLKVDIPKQEKISDTPKRATGRGRKVTEKAPEADPEVMAFAQRFDMLQNYHNVKLTAEEDALARERERQNKAASDYEAYLKTKLGMDSVYYAGLQTVSNTASVFMAQKNKKLFRFGQGLAIAQTIMSTQQGMIKAYAQLGPIAGIAGAAVVAAAGALSIKRIASQKPPEFAVGSYSVPADMPAVIHKGEMILDRDTAQSARDLAESGPAQTNVYVDGQKLFDVSEMYRDEAAQNIGSVGSFPVESAY